MGRLRRTASDSLCVLFLNIAVTFFLSSCNIDKEKEEQVVQADRSRPVFGQQPQTDKGKPQQGQTAPREQPQARVTRSREQGPVVAEPASERFLYYRPPGSRVGDSGERPSGNRDRTLPPESISGLIHRWADTLLSRNLSAHMELYAPVLERFGSRTKVSRDEVKQEKQRFLASLANVRRFEIHNLRVREIPRGQLATVEFRTEWSTDRKVNQSVRQRLTFRRINGHWRIQSEERLPEESRRR